MDVAKGNILSGIKKIVFTGDILRPGPDFKSTQSTNIVWLYHLLIPYIKASVDNLSLSVLLWNDETSGFDVPRFYELCNLEINAKNWAKLSSYDRINEEAGSYCNDFFSHSLIIGYETAPVFLKIFDELNVPYIDFVVHPVRFMDDIFFGIRSNINAINEILEDYKLNENVIYAYAGLHLAAIRRMNNLGLQEESALIVGQKKVDRSLVSNGFIKRIFDYESDIIELTNKFKYLYYKFHPLEQTNKEIINFCQKHGIVVIDKNIYHIICQKSIISVYSLSSSVIHECKYFDVPGYFLIPEQTFDYIPVYDAFLSFEFWYKILSVFFQTGKTVNFKMPAKTNRLRNSLGMYWGYPFLDDERLHNHLHSGSQQNMIDKVKGYLNLGTWGK